MKTYSSAYSLAYHQTLDGMVEEQMQASVKHVADLWYTCWVQAGMPDLNNLEWKNIGRESREEEQYTTPIKSRSHAATGLDILNEKD